MSSKMLKAAPDHHDAEIVMKLYDLRREAVMRASRAAINSDFWPKRFDDIVAVTAAGHALNAPFRQVTGYWEMAYGMVKHGILNADFMLESGTEGLYVFARVKPYLAQVRELMGPRAFMNAEWIATNSEFAASYVAHLEPRIAKMTAAK